MKLYGVELKYRYRDEGGDKCSIYLYTMANDEVDARQRALKQFKNNICYEDFGDEDDIDNIKKAVENSETYKISEMAGGVTHVIW